jgi:putative sigma-54 modulation protein
MSEEEAVLQMELLEHQFYIFKDSETNNIAVVYKRKEGNYGIIESE